MTALYLCPQCDGVLRPGRGGLLVCENGDYEVLRIDFERVLDALDDVRRQQVDGPDVEQALRDMNRKGRR